MAETKHRPKANGIKGQKQPYPLKMAEEKGKQCLVINADARDARVCADAVEKTALTFGKSNILVNNAACQMVQKYSPSIREERFPRTVETNIFCYLYIANIPGTMPIEEVENFGHEMALARLGQDEELAPAYVLPASRMAALGPAAWCTSSAANFSAMLKTMWHFR